MNARRFAPVVALMFCEVACNSNAETTSAGSSEPQQTTQGAEAGSASGSGSSTGGKAGSGATGSSTTAKPADAGAGGTGSGTGAGMGAGTGTGTVGGGGKGGLNLPKLPNLPIPANVLALLRQMTSAAMLRAIEAATNGLCAAELESMEKAVMPTLSNASALADALKNGSSPDLTAINEKVNAFVHCVVQALPDLAAAFGGAALQLEGGARLPLSLAVTQGVESAPAPTPAPGLLPVPTGLPQMAAQLTSGGLQVARAEAEAREICLEPLRHLQSVTPPVVADLQRLGDLNRARPLSEMRAYQAAGQNFLLCMAREAPDLAGVLWAEPER